ncbi:MAG: ABC transporter ATP-binding protein [Phycisphaerales bacterium]|nr:ABC transporter ATP-binding protein [Phycisphaerales bacterium]
MSVDGSTPSQPEPIIRVRDLVKRFDGRAVLDGVSLDVTPGQTLVIMGGSGCGKSTLLRCLIGSLRPEEGSIEMFGRDLCNLSEEGMDTVRKKFGILFQSGALYNSMTVAENVALPLSEHTDLDPQTIETIVTIKLEQVGLREHADKYPGQISGGMKKRAGLARAMALDPQVLFYDEPSAGLDPVTSAEIDQLIIGMTRGLGVTSIVVTHEMDSAFTIADRMVMLDKGRVLRADDRAWFENLRALTEDEARRRVDSGAMNEDEQLIRQFLRGDADGPITARRSASSYADDLLRGRHPVNAPAVQSTKPVRKDEARP